MCIGTGRLMNPDPLHNAHKGEDVISLNRAAAPGKFIVNGIELLIDDDEIFFSGKYFGYPFWKRFFFWRNDWKDFRFGFRKRFLDL